MVNNTVNGKRIGEPAGKEDKLKFNYFVCGKKSEKHKMDTEINKAKSSISIGDFFRKEDIIEETPEYVLIKTYPGGNPNKNKEKHSEDLSH